METLYRKYRPKNFSEVEGQTHIVRTLKNSIAGGRIGHAYLFTGPRGTGKTTLARIFSLAINCHNAKDSNPCGQCESCQNILKGSSLSIIEIDAASHTGVDNIRALREEAVLPPMDSARYKIYIIDEVHMLSKGAFNALLKILEEPPKHIIFILATTEIQKVPETILSRCQRFDFSQLPLKNIIDKLTRIAKAEKVKLDPEVLEMVAIASAGGMRDAESLLSQLFSANDTHITIKEAEEILGFSHRSTAKKFVSALTARNISDALRAIGEAVDNGYNLDHFVETVLYKLRQMLFLRVSENLASELKNEMTAEEIRIATQQVRSLSLAFLVRAIDLLLVARTSMKSSFLPQIPLETAVIKILDTAPTPAPGTSSQTPDAPQSAQIKTSPSVSAIPQQPNTVKKSANPDKVHSSPSLRTSADLSSRTTPSPSLRVSPPLAEVTTTIHPNTPIHSATPTVKEEIKQSSKAFTLEDVFPVWQKCIDETQAKNALLGTFLGESNITRVEGNTIHITTASEFYKNTLEKKENRLTIENILGILLGTRVSLQITVGSTSKEESDPLIRSVLEAFGNAVA